MTPELALAVLLAAACGGFGWLAIALWTGYLQPSLAFGGTRWSRTRIDVRVRARLAAAAVLGATVLVATRWLPLAIATSCSILQ